MDAAIYKNSPLRRLNWRAERVMQMVEHQPSPLKARWHDDRYVRTYRIFLLAYLSAGQDEELRHAAIGDWPHVYHAHLLRFAPDRRLRDVLEARLLTVEPLAEIANRFATEPLAIEFYEALFFNVRDRLNHKVWIAKVIKTPFGDLSPNMRGDATEDQRGYLYRWLGYHGGPLVLDALFSRMSSTEMPGRAESAAQWCDHALGQTLRSRVAEVASVLEINQRNAPRLIKMALRLKRANAAARARAKSAQTEVDQHIAKMAERLDRLRPKPSSPAADGTDETNSTTPT